MTPRREVFGSLALLRARGKMSVREIASELGRTPKSLYGQLDRYVEQGLLAPATAAPHHKHPPGRRGATRFFVLAPKGRALVDTHRPLPVVNSVFNLSLLGKK